MLDAHSRVYAPMPLHLGSTFVPRLSRLGPMASNEQWIAFVREVVDRIGRGKGQLDKPLDCTELVNHVSERSFRSLYTSIYTDAMTRQNKEILVLKELHLHRDLWFYLACHPEAKIVAQVRDPRDYILSCRNVAGAAAHYGSDMGALNVWLDDQVGVLTMLTAMGPQRVFMQRYEDLIASPEAVLRSLCGFIGVEYENTMLRFNERQEAMAAAQANKKFWKNLAQPLIPDNTHKYRTGLTPLTNAAIERKVGNLMSAFGYDSEYSHSAVYSRLATMMFASHACADKAKAIAVRRIKRTIRRTNHKSIVPTGNSMISWPYEVLPTTASVGTT